jgi:Double zinc ribbon
MELSNYRDLSVASSSSGAGFQFEFRCTHCSTVWRSPFQPYRAGRLNDLLQRASHFVSSIRQVSVMSNTVVSNRANQARLNALQEAMQEARTMFTVCHSCGSAVCNDCFSAQADSCLKCASKQREPAEGQAGGSVQASGASCPNCQTPSDGGRFCAECGYDLASTHKSCPACGVMTSRSARFCTDCGHAF